MRYRVGPLDSAEEARGSPADSAIVSASATARGDKSGGHRSSATSASQAEGGEYCSVLAVSEEPLRKSAAAAAAAAAAAPEWDPSLGPFASGPHAVPPPKRRRQRGLGRRLRAILAPIFSIRWLFILSAILQVGGAIAVSWAVTSIISQRSVEQLSATFVREMQDGSVAAVQSFLHEAMTVCERVKDDLETGRLQKAAWRGVLESLADAVTRFPAVSASAVRFADGTVLAAERCAGADACPTGRRAVFANGTHAWAFDAAARGQPAAFRALFPIPSGADSWYSATLASATGEAFLTERPGGYGAGRQLPPEPVSLLYAMALKGPAPLDGLLAPGPTPGPAAPDATPPDFFARAASAAGAPAAGAAAVRMPVSSLSQALAEAVSIQGSLLILTTAEGRMVASSARDPSHVVGPGMAPLAASESPDALTRELYGRAGPLLGGEADGVASFRLAGVDYWANGARVSRAPGLEWRMYAAVPKDGITAELRRGMFVSIVVNSLWFCLSVFVAGLIGFFITRPIDKLRASMSILLDTMGRLSGELQAHVAPEDLEPHGAQGHGRRRASAASTTSEAAAAASEGRSTLRELGDFEALMADMHARFVAFQEVVSAETKTKIEMQVRSEETKKFLATVSHEMRTPLNGILGMLDLAREASDPREAADCIEAAATSGDHLLSLVNDILDLQKIEAGLIELQCVPVDVRATVLGAIRIVKRKADEKCLELAVDVADNVPEAVLGDPDRIRQVLLNLVSNGVKYTHEGRVAVAVRVRAAGEGGGPAGSGGMLESLTGERLVVRFDVRDSGPGIDPQHQVQLFQRFYRVQPLLGGGPDPGGTGLGLAISREIVEKCGGSIGCVSAPGEGSTFWFELPVLRMDGGEEDGSPGAEGEGDEAAAGGAGVTSLVSAAGQRPGRRTPSDGRTTPGGLKSARSQLTRSPSGSNRAEGRGSMTSAGNHRSSGTGERGPPRRACAVLVAEDNGVSARVITSMLQRDGHRVDLASNGKEAVDRFAAAVAAAVAARAPGAGPAGRLWDAVFMDCMMPVMDGYEATGAIRRLEAAAGLPRHLIIALTAKAGSEDEAECRAAGMDAFLPKPVRRPALQARPAASEGGRLGPTTPQALLDEVLEAEEARSPRPPDEGRPPALNWGLGGMASVAEGPPPPPEPAAACLEPPPHPQPPPPASPHSGSGSSLPGSRRHSPGASRLGSPSGSFRHWPSAAAGGGSPRRTPDGGFLPADLVQRLAEPGGSGRFAALQPADVLVVDDVEMNRRVLCALLAKDGHRVAVACDGQEAVALFERRARELAGRAGAGPLREPVFGLVLMDVAMPTMDGYQATRCIRHVEEVLRAAATPIVACTALSSSKDREDMMAAGMDDVLVKPVARSKLIPMLHKWLRKPADPRASPSVGRWTAPNSPVPPTPAAAVALHSNSARRFFAD